MDDIRVLQFRLGSETYSIPAADVSAVLQSNRASRLPQNYFSDAGESIDQTNRFLQVLDNQVVLAAKDGMATIILHVNGMQVALVVDEVIKEVKLDKIGMQSSSLVSLILWKIGERKWIGVLPRKSNYLN